jgi:hypothetical protein
MRRADIGLITFHMHVGDKQVLQVKVYRDGTLIRIGAGSMPAIPIGAVSYWPGNGVFDKLMDKVPPQLIAHDIDYREEVASRAVVYEMRLSGNLINGKIGEQSTWADTRLLRFHLDIDTKFRSPVLVLLDNLMKDAMAHTNSWYFDALILAIFERRSSHLPKQTFIAKAEGEDLSFEFGNFLSQMLHNPRKWNFMVFPEGKTYFDEEGKPHKLIFKIDGGKFSFNWL